MSSSELALRGADGFSLSNRFSADFFLDMVDTLALSGPEGVMVSVESPRDARLLCLCEYERCVSCKLQLFGS